MSIDSIHEFIKGLENHFIPPKHVTTEAQKAWLTNMVNALHGSAPEVLDRARRRIIETRKNRYFPLVAEIRQACRDAADELKFDQYAQKLPTLREAVDSDWSADRLKLARDICCSTDLGRRAAREGWVLSMRDFVREHKRAPKDHEITECKRTAKDFDDLYALCLRGQAGPLSASLAKLGEGMLAKREELAREALGR